MDKIIQVLDVEHQCRGLYTNGKFLLDNYSLAVEESDTAWVYSPIISQDENYTFLSLFLKGRDLSEYSQFPSKMKSTKLLFESQKKAALDAKVDLREFCFFDIIPDHLLHNWFSLRESALKTVSRLVPRPSDYDILHKIHVVISKISRQRLNFGSNSGEKIQYDMFSSSTGRLTTKRGSFPILNIDKGQRALITPQNDLFLELDLNGAEIRTLLALSGVEQPNQDIHEWNMRGLPPWTTRAKAKEDFFAWLYNPKAESSFYERYYNKNIYLQHYDGTSVETPFGRRLTVDTRRALNYLIQSTTSDMVMESAYKIVKKLAHRRSFLAFTMHDSVVLDFSKDDHDLVLELKDIFESNRYGRFLSNINIGKNFGSMRKLEI